MGVERFYKEQLIYKNKKYVGLYSECYPIKMLNHKYVGCIMIGGEERNKPSKIYFETIELVNLTKLLRPLRVEKQMVWEYPTHDEYNYGSVFIIEAEKRFMYISIGGNFALAIPNDLNSIIGMHILSISKYICDDERMYMINIDAAANVLEYHLKQIKKKDSIFDKIQNHLCSRDIYRCCSELVKNYMSSIGLSVENYYIRRNIEGLLEYCLKYR